MYTTSAGAAGTRDVRRAICLRLDEVKCKREWSRVRRVGVVCATESGGKSSSRPRKQFKKQRERATLASPRAQRGARHAKEEGQAVLPRQADMGLLGVYYHPFGCATNGVPSRQEEEQLREVLALPAREAETRVQGVLFVLARQDEVQLFRVQSRAACDETHAQGTLHGEAGEATSLVSRDANNKRQEQGVQGRQGRSDHLTARG